MKLCKEKNLACYVGCSTLITKVETPHIDSLNELKFWKWKELFLGRRGPSIDQLLLKRVATSHTALICTWDFILTRYGKMTDKETIALKEKFIVCNSQEGVRRATQGHIWKYQVWSGGSQKESTGTNLYCGFLEKVEE